MENKENIYEAIKADFYQKYKNNIDKGDYHEKDLERLKADLNNDWLKAFYKHGFSNHDKTVNIMHEVLLWRKDFDANNLLTPGNLPFPFEYLHKGSIFFRNEDINCNPILHFAVKLHKKEQFPFAQVCKFIAFHFERAYKFNEDDPIVLLFDMSEAGYSNLDMDMIKFVISCLKTYYPGLISYMIIFQMPFIFNAAWKIIKNWLPPEGVKLIKFCDKKSIREYVQESQLFVHMGGTDTYKYSFDPKVYPEASECQEPHITSSKSTSAVLASSSGAATAAAAASISHHHPTSNKKNVVTSASIANIVTTANGSATTSPMSIPVNDSSNTTSSVTSDDVSTTPTSATTPVTEMSIVETREEQAQQPVKEENVRVVKSSTTPVVENAGGVIDVNSTNGATDQQTIYTMELTRSQVNFTLSDDSPISITKQQTTKPEEETVSTSSASTKPSTVKPASKMNGMVNGGTTGRSFDASKASELSFDNALTTPLLSISPGDELVYNVSDGKADIMQYIKLTNTSGVSLAYKIKITSPDKFRVKPGTGIIQTSACVQIMISFLKEFHLGNTNNRDKFLILWTPIDEQQIQQHGNELNEFWKQAIQKKINVNEHKVKCVIIRPSTLGGSESSKHQSGKQQLSTSSSHGSTHDNISVGKASVKLNKVLGEPLVSDDKEISPEQMQKNESQLMKNKILGLEMNVQDMLNHQRQMMQQQSRIMIIVFILLILNVIQFLFYS